MSELVKWAAVVGGDNLEDALGSVRELRAALDDRLVELVRHARLEAWTWERIGRTLGVTAQAAYSRYAALVLVEDWDLQSGGIWMGPQVR